MAEVVAEKTVCEGCGATVRDESLFCYNCGNAVSTDRTETAAEPAVDAPKNLEIQPPLRSAASLRRQRRAFNRQPVEISWEPRESSPVLFIAATIVLSAAALILLLLALYLR
jgi:hypothetical protein